VTTRVLSAHLRSSVGSAGHGKCRCENSRTRCSWSRPNSGVAPSARASKSARTVSWCSTMWRSEWSRPNEDCIGSSCSSPANPLHQQHGLAESTQGCWTGGSGARSQTHVRTALAYCRRVVGDAQSSAWPQDRGNHQSLQRPGTRRADPSGERDPQDAGIDFAARGGAAAEKGGEWREKSRKSRAAQTRKRLASLQAFDYLARPAGFEPTTPWFVALDSNNQPFVS